MSYSAVGAVTAEWASMLRVKRWHSEEAMGSAPGGLRRVSKRRWLVSYTDKEGKGISSRA